MVNKKKKNVAIMGAAGRDFHNFLVKYKDDAGYDVKFFTATQIPGIAGRRFPGALAGRLYRKGIPIFLEKDLVSLIKKYKIDDVVFSYSDVKHVDVMHKASIVNAAGANFVLLGVHDTALKSKKKVVSICAVRTGAGKSPTSRRIADVMLKAGKKIVAIRHPMPYGDLVKQRVQRFADYEDLERHKTTIEEREEYEPWVKKGIPIYAGVDYAAILKEAEKEAEIIIWDGGNNDLPFILPDLHIVVADPHRPGHELLYHPGEANFRMADVILISKVGSAKRKDVDVVRKHAEDVNPSAEIVEAALSLVTKNTKSLRGKRVLVVEDGPTLTHGEMSYGAGYLAAKKYGAKIVKPAKYAVGSIKEVYKKFKQVKYVLPAMGYGGNQMYELQQTINRAKCDYVIDSTPVDLDRLININKPVIEIDYVLKERGVSFDRVLKKWRII
jgi:predicted GTPase